MNAVTPILTPVVLQNESLLRALASEGPFVSLSALAKHLGRDASNIRRSLKSLEDEGLVARPEDRADALPDITGHGHSALAALDRANGVGVELVAPWSAFKPHPLNPRKAFDAEALDELGHDILHRGQDQNIVCRPPGPDGVLFIRSGERRWRSIGRMIEAGEASEDFPLRYIVRDEDDAAHLVGALGENLQRAALNPIEEAEAFAYMRDTLNYSTAEIGALISKGQRFVQLRLQLLTAPEIVQVSVREGKMGVMEALSKVQEKKAPAAPEAWTPNSHSQRLTLVEIVHACGEDMHVPLHGWPNSKHLEGFVYNIGLGYSSDRMFIHENCLELLDRLDLNPRKDPTALFRARQLAGLSPAHIRSLEATGLYVTTFLNPPPAAKDEPPRSAADPSEGAASPAAPSRSFADQLAEATQDDEVETQEMFPDAEEQAPPAVEAQAPQPPARNAFAVARRLHQEFQEDVVGQLVGLEHDDDFNWEKADMGALAARMTFAFAHGDVLQMAGLAAVMYARGGEFFSERALTSAWNAVTLPGRQWLDAAVPHPSHEVELTFDLNTANEIVDAETRSVVARLMRDVAMEDAKALRAAPELRRALLGVLSAAVRPNPADEDPESLAAWAFAEAVAAAADKGEG